METSDLIRDKGNYEYFKNEIYRMIGYLNNAISLLESSKDKVDSSFSLDDSKADEGKINSIYNRLVAERDFLQNTCIPSINQKISNVKKAINSVM